MLGPGFCEPWATRNDTLNGFAELTVCTSRLDSALGAGDTGVLAQELLPLLAVGVGRMPGRVG